MGSTSVSLDCTQRLADQLQCLTEVAETLTLRLLELEDRLAVQEQQLQPFLAAAEGGDAEDLEATEQRLSETEQRLGRLESLLNAPQGSGRVLQAVPSGRVPDPFPAEEEEQPFLDELAEVAPAFERPRPPAALAELQEDFDLELQQA